MISARGVFRRFGARTVLAGLDLDVGPGAVTLIVGANGAGKTTFLRIVTGLCVPDAGEVRVAGRDVVRERIQVLRALSFLPQAPRFHPRLTTRQVARYYGRLRGRRMDEVEGELEAWGMTDHCDTTTAELSGGLRQRLAICIFSLARARVLVLDEPGLSLDPHWRDRLQLHLSARAREGATVLVATHLLAEWEGRADCCLLLEHGQVRGTLAPGRLRESFPLRFADDVAS